MEQILVAELLKRLRRVEQHRDKTVVAGVPAAFVPGSEDHRLPKKTPAELAEVVCHQVAKNPRVLREQWVLLPDRGQTGVSPKQ
jgi:hypothetical protein